MSEHLLQIEQKLVNDSTTHAQNIFIFSSKQPHDVTSLERKVEFLSGAPFNLLIHDKGARRVKIGDKNSPVLITVNITVTGSNWKEVYYQESDDIPEVLKKSSQNYSMEVERSFFAARKLAVTYKAANVSYCKEFTKIN